MESGLKIYSSNRVELLYHGLKKHLFATSHPFTKRMIIVPSAAMKSWLMLQMAQDPQLGISGGVEIGLVDSTLNDLYNLLGSQTVEKEPSEVELALTIEEILCGTIISLDLLPAKELAIWRPLLDYLGVSRGSYAITKRVANRIGALAATLANLFADYGLYGGKMVEAWHATSETNAMAAWQQLLWKKIEQQMKKWNYPYRKYKNFKPLISPFLSDRQIHIFGLSYLASLHHHFLASLAEHLPVYYYMLSPCQKFWTDLRSDRENMRIRNYWQKQNISPSQQESLEEYLRNGNPMLANFGRLGREMASLLEADDPCIEEVYALPSSAMNFQKYDELVTPDLFVLPDSTSLTLLEAIQSDILLLRNPEEGEKIIFDGYDGTIQIHAAPKPMREVQIVYDAAMNIIEKHAQDEVPITPGDIVVMASNLAIYEPFIHAVFSSEESALSAQIMDVQTPSQNQVVQAFLHLLNLPLGRWNLTALLDLFGYPVFQLKHGISDDDVQRFHRWAKKASIRWGNDLSHRNELLRRDHCTKDMDESCWHGTWEHGLGRLLEGIAMISSSHGNDAVEIFSPVEGVEATQCDLLGNFLRLLQALHADMKPLVDGTKLSLLDWSAYLKCLCESYFSSTGDGDKEGHEILCSHIEALSHVHEELKEASFAFHSIHRYLEKSLQSTISTYRESNLQAIRFCSLLPMRAVPAKVIILMGMGEGQFPRADATQSLNLLKNHSEGDYYPSQIDFDRYLFLEALLSARRYFIMSYVFLQPGTTQMQQPSLLLTELMSYMNKAYGLSSGSLQKHCWLQHPLSAHHHRYFHSEANFRSHFMSQYKMCLAHYMQGKQPAKSFIQDFIPQEIPDEAKEVETTIELSDLMAFARSPLQAYFNKTLEIYFDKTAERVIKNDENLLVTPIDAAQLLKASLKMSSEKVLVQALQSGKLPHGPFKALEEKRLKREVQEIKTNLEALDLHLEELQFIEFNERYISPLKMEKGWHLPPIHCDVPGIGKIGLVGHLENISPSGMVVVAEDEMKEAIKIWPQWLIFCCLVKKHALPFNSSLIFAKGKKVSIKSGEGMDADDLLKHFLQYYFKGLQSPSPLMPECVSLMLEGAWDKVKQMYHPHEQDGFRPIYDEYQKWLKRSSPNAITEKGNEHWQGIAKTLFVEMNQKWYK